MPTNDTAATAAGATALLAEWISDRRHTELPPEVRHHAVRLVVDHMGAAIPGAVEPVTRAVAKHAAVTYGGDHATALGAGRMSAAGAALVNATAAHVLELDDGYTSGSVHPSAPVIPAVLAAAQKHGASIETALRAVATGVEIACRIAAAGHPATRNRGFHNTALAGVFGAAAGVAVVLDLRESDCASTLGVAGSHAGGLFEFLGTPASVKPFHAGKAARDGLASAELAAVGLTGPHTVLEGTNGYFAAFAGAPGAWSPERLVDDLGRSWSMLETYIKPYPCCRHLHAAVDAALILRDRLGGETQNLRSGTVGTYSIATRHDHQSARTVAEAQMSMPYAVAAALRFGTPSLAEFDREHRADPEVTRLLSAITVHVDSEHESAYPAARPATLTLITSDGALLQETVLQPYGEPSNPMSDEALTAKFLDIAGPVLGSEADALVRDLWALHDLDFLDRIDTKLRSHD